MGEAKTSPSTAGVEIRCSGPLAAGMDRETPVRDMFPWYVGQSTNAGPAAELAGTLGDVATRGGTGDWPLLVFEAKSVAPPQAAKATKPAAARVLTGAQRMPDS